MSIYDKQFTPIKFIGKGRFSTVFEARNNLDHQRYAIKRIELTELNDLTELNISTELKKLRALAQLSHPHLVRYHLAWISDTG